MLSSAPHSEKLMLLNVAEGNQQAFDFIFFKYHSRIEKYVLCLTESYPLTQEIVQDVFLKIWLTRERLPSIEHFESYLFTIARNQSLNCMRQIARDQARILKWAEIDASQLLPDEEHSGMLIIEEGIQKLPPRQRNIYLLSRHSKLSRKQIAEYLDISVETVKKHRLLALRFIKAYVYSRLKLIILFLTSFLFFFCYLHSCFSGVFDHEYMTFPF